MNTLLFHKFIIASSILMMGMFAHIVPVYTQAVQEKTTQETSKSSGKVVTATIVQVRSAGGTAQQAGTAVVLRHKGESAAVSAEKGEATVVLAQKEGESTTPAQVHCNGQNVFIIEQPEGDKTADGKPMKRKAIVRTQCMVKNLDDANMPEDVKAKLKDIDKNIQLQIGDDAEGMSNVQIMEINDDSKPGDKTIHTFRVHGNMDTTITNGKQMRILVKNVDGKEGLPADVQEMIKNGNGSGMQEVEVNIPDIHVMKLSDDKIQAEIEGLVHNLQSQGGSDSLTGTDGHTVKVIVHKFDGTIPDDVKDLMKKLGQEASVDAVSNKDKVQCRILIISDEEKETTKNGSSSTDGKSTLDAQTASLEVNNFSAFPNPSDGIIHLDFDAPQSGSMTVKVVDLAGNTVFLDHKDAFSGHYKQQIDLTGKSKGVYFIRIEQDGKSMSKKIVLQ